MKENIHDALALYLEDMREDDSDSNSANIIAKRNWNSPSRAIA